jgi:predicted DCC family thiol-disulfide oxidoreductase YuxK
MGALIHGVRPDGSLVIGAETIRLAYRAVGLGHLAAPTALPLLKPVFDLAYAAFARNRYGLSRVLGPVIERIEARRAVRRAQACANGTCAVDQPVKTTRSTS